MVTALIFPGPSFLTQRCLSVQWKVKAVEDQCRGNLFVGIICLFCFVFCFRLFLFLFVCLFVSLLVFVSVVVVVLFCCLFVFGFGFWGCLFVVVFVFVFSTNQFGIYASYNKGA